MAAFAFQRSVFPHAACVLTEDSGECSLDLSARIAPHSLRMHFSMLVRRACLATAACFVCIYPADVRSESDSLHVDLGGEVRLDLIEISPGAFTQGSATDEPGHRPDETQHEVRITKKYFLGKYPVTRIQFARFVADSGY